MRGFRVGAPSAGPRPNKKTRGAVAGHTGAAPTCRRRDGDSSGRGQKTSVPSPPMGGRSSTHCGKVSRGFFFLYWRWTRTKPGAAPTAAGDVGWEGVWVRSRLGRDVSDDDPDGKSPCRWVRTVQDRDAGNASAVPMFSHVQPTSDEPRLARDAWRGGANLEQVVGRLGPAGDARALERLLSRAGGRMTGLRGQVVRAPGARNASDRWRNS